MSTNNSKARQAAALQEAAEILDSLENASYRVGGYSLKELLKSRLAEIGTEDGTMIVNDVPTEFGRLAAVESIVLSALSGSDIITTADGSTSDTNEAI